MKRLFFIVFFGVFVNLATADDGAQLWLQSPSEADGPERCLAVQCDVVLAPQDSLMMRRAAALLSGWKGAALHLAIVPDSTSGSAEMDDGYSICRCDTSISLTAVTPRGLMYGAYHLLRAQAMDDVCLCRLMAHTSRLRELPAYKLRLVVVPAELLDGQWIPFVQAAASVGLNGIVSERSDAYVSRLCADYGMTLYEPSDLDALSFIHLSTAVGGTDSLLYKPSTWSTQLTMANGVVLEGLEQPFDSPFCSANWYAFARLAWNPHLSLRTLAYEWVAQTYSSNPICCMPVVQALLSNSNTVAIDALGMIDPNM